MCVCVLFVCVCVWVPPPPPSLSSPSTLCEHARAPACMCAVYLYACVRACVRACMLHVGHQNPTFLNFVPTALAISPYTGSNKLHDCSDVTSTASNNVTPRPSRRTRSSLCTSQNAHVFIVFVLSLTFIIRLLFTLKMCVLRFALQSISALPV